MELIDHEELLSALEELVGEFGDHVAPYAVTLTKKLVENYLKLIAQIDEDTEGNYGESGMAASSCVMAIKRVVSSCANTKSLLAELGPIVFPVVVNTMHPDYMDTIDEGLEIISIIMYGTETVTPQFLSLFVNLLRVAVGGPNEEDGGYGYEYLA
jgi:hypothetical protein